MPHDLERTQMLEVAREHAALAFTRPRSYNASASSHNLHEHLVVAVHVVNATVTVTNSARTCMQVRCSACICRQLARTLA